MNRIIICLLALSFSTTLLSARSIRAIFIKGGVNAPKSAVLQIGEKPLDIDLPRRNLSAEVDLPKGALTVAILSKALEAGEQIPETAQKLVIPEAWKRCIIVFLPDPENLNFPAKAALINASDTNFSLGSTLIYNLTQATVIGKFGDKSIVVKARNSAMLKGSTTASGAYPVMIDCLYPDSDKRIAVCRSSWIYYPKDRQILFVLTTPGSKSPRIWGVKDRPKREYKKVE